MSTKLESIADLAKRIGKSERQVRGWIDNSLLRHNRLGGKIEIPEGAFEEMLVATEIAPAFKRKSRNPESKHSRQIQQVQAANMDQNTLDKLAAEF